MTARPPLFRTLPTAAVALGAAGLIPFAILGLASVGTSEDGSVKGVVGLIAYGAVILSFIGGVHWGFALGAEDDDEPARVRLSLAVVPSLIGWAAVLAGVLELPLIGLAVLIAGYIGTVMIEHRAAKRQLMPSGYMALRWVLTSVAVIILLIVLVLRLIGGHLFF
jgi:hypothetical protein